MSSAHDERLHGSAAAHEIGAHALWPVHLVGADREQMAAEAAHIKLDLACSLHGIDMEEGACGAGDLCDLFNGLKDAGLVVGQHHAD